MNPADVINDAISNGITYETLTAYIEGLHAKGELTDKDYSDIVMYIMRNGDLASSPRDLIQLYRGNRADLPTLAQGEPAFCMDTGEFFIGNINSNTLINGLRGKRVIAIGDGFTHAYNPAVENALNIARGYTGMSTDDFITAIDDNGGIANGGYLNAINAIQPKSPATITDIYFLGGLNDNQYVTQEQFNTGAAAIFSKCKSTYPNATIHAVYTPWSYDTNTNLSNFVKAHGWYETLPRFGFKFHPNGSYVTHWASYYLTSNQGNLSDAGINALATYFASLIGGTDDTFFRGPTSSNVTTAGPGTLKNPVAVTETLCSGINTITVQGTTSRQTNSIMYEFNNPTTILLAGRRLYTIGTFTPISSAAKNGAISIPSTMYLINTDGSQQLTLGCRITVDLGSLGIEPQQVTNTGTTDDGTFSNAKRMFICAGTASYPAFTI